LYEGYAHFKFLRVYQVCPRRFWPAEEKPWALKEVQMRVRALYLAAREFFSRLENKLALSLLLFFVKDE
jgi:hypothetical protein